MPSLFRPNWLKTKKSSAHEVSHFFEARLGSPIPRLATLSGASAVSKTLPETFAFSTLAPYNGTSFAPVMSPNLTQTSRGLYRFAVATSCCTILLLMAGALVTSNNAAESVPDWPLAYGRLIPPLIGGIKFEYTHRVIAGVVSILTLILAVWLAAAERRPLAKRLGWTALGLVLAQGALGGFRVLEGVPSISATAHATLAQIFFIIVVGLSLYLSPWWQSDLAPLGDRGSPRLRALALWMTASILVQLILGAAFRHGAFGIVPHLIGAGVVTVFIIWAGVAAKRRFRQVRDLRRATILLHSFFGIQILLGGAGVVGGDCRRRCRPAGSFVCRSRGCARAWRCAHAGRRSDLHADVFSADSFGCRRGSGFGGGEAVARKGRGLGG